jgi:hypothetical protein
MNYEKGYFYYKTKYRILKNLIGGTPNETEIETSELINKLNDNENEFKLEDLDKDEYNKLESEVDIPDRKGNLPIQIYIETGGTDQDILEFLLPSEELYTHQNNNGDTILITAGKILNNEEVIVYLWFKGLKIAKDIKNIDGLNLLELIQKIVTSENSYLNQLEIVSQLYNENLEYDVKHLFEERNVLSISNNLDEPIKKNKKVPIIENVPLKRELKIINSSITEFEQDYSKNKDLFIYGLNELNEAIDFGLSLESLYVDRTTLSKVPIEPQQILQVKIIDFNNDKLRNYLISMEGIIGVIKETDKIPFNIFKNK